MAQSSILSSAVAAMAVLVIVGSTGATVLAYVAARLADARVTSRLGAASGGYGLTVIPAALGDLLGRTPVPVSVQVGRYGALVTGAVGLFAGFMAMRTSRRARIGDSGDSGSWAGLVLGTGMVLIASTHGLVVIVTDAGAPADCCASGLRLCGVFLVLIATGERVRSALALANQEWADQQEELRMAHLDVRRAAERNHEMRNVIAGLAGAVDMIEFRSGDGESGALRAAMASELVRLESLLDGGVLAEESLEMAEVGGDAALEYRVLPVLRGLVALRRSSGMDIDLDCELGLGAVGSSTILAQVMANVLSNCAAHAPGSPVRIDADRDGDAVRVFVSDLGPGISVEPGQDIFESGVRGTNSEGSGFGLHICRRLLEAQGGTISIRPRLATQPGCTVELTVPAAKESEASPALLVGRSA
ncbi:MAG TPA: HAMP domain-containing sensor histidine kinase [Pseudonocardia sp.]|jgi:two-component system OmpR family sensor kinase|nr:HAMP domain-containing sensor histidine kinase [Pseudonocardia sp.]